MNKKIFLAILIVLSLIVVRSALSVSEDTLTSDEFQQIANPTASDLSMIEQPSLDDFKKIPPKEQKIYLASNYDDKLAGEYLKSASMDEEDLKIADKFFVEELNLNNPLNLNVRHEYFKSKGYNFLEMTGDVAGWSPETGVLTLTEGGVQSQKDMDALKGKYDFKLDVSGNFFLIKKNSQKEYAVSGSIEDNNGNLEIDGTIQGKRISGKGFMIIDEGIVFKNLEQYEGMKIEQKDKQSSAIIDKEFKTIYIKDATIENIPTGITLHGENIHVPDGIILKGSATKTMRGWEIGEFSNMQTMNKELIQSSQSRVLLLTDPTTDLSKYSETNYVFSNSNRLKINTVEDKNGQKTEVTVELIPGHELFDMKKLIQQGSKVAYVPDNEQNMKFIISSGASVDSSERKNNHKIPLIKAEVGKGEIKIMTGKLNLEVRKDRIYAGNDANSNQWSVPFEINENKREFLVNQANQYSYSSDSSKILTDKFGFPFTNDIDTNSIKTLTDLRQRFPNKEFIKNKDGSKSDDFEIDRSSAGYLNYWINEIEEEEYRLDGFIFESQALAEYLHEKNMIGFKEEKIKNLRSISMTGQISSMPATMWHEYEHKKDFTIKLKEDTIIAERLNKQESKEIREITKNLAEEEKLTYKYGKLVSEHFYEKVYSDPKFQKIVEQISQTDLKEKFVNTLSDNKKETIAKEITEELNSNPQSVDFTSSHMQITGATYELYTYLYNNKKYREDAMKLYELMKNAGYNIYSTRNYFYSSEESSAVKPSGFYEVSSTFAEYEVKSLLNNPTTHQFAIDMMQLNCDSGKDCTQLKKYVGCEKPDCCDKKCKLYTLTCEGAC